MLRDKGSCVCHCKITILGYGDLLQAEEGNLVDLSLGNFLIWPSSTPPPLM